KIGEKLAREALLAVFFSILFMAIYICGRFEHRWIASAIMAGALSGAVYVAYIMGVSIKVMIIIAAVLSIVISYLLRFNYSIGAMVALIHDITITLGAVLVTDIEISIPLVAALLTIIGYSLNDTIIVYDRIRENLRTSLKSDFANVINRSVNQTLSRTLLTAGTTILALIILYFLGGAIIKDFCFVLIVGLFVGTYSSVYIASPVLLYLKRDRISKM
ncbi:MAG: protein translocase subunit SecF, partial [Desulfatiglandales bacterium]